MKLRIRELREAKGLTVEQLAERIGVSKSYLSEIERGVKVVNARRLDQLAEALACDPTDLLASGALSDDLREHLALMKTLDQGQRAEVYRFARFRARGGE